MWNRRLIFIATLAICGLGFAAVVVIGTLDRQHRINLETFDGFVFVLASPFVGVAAASSWWRAHRWLPLAGLAAALICLCVSVWGILDSHLAWSRTKPGQEVMYLGGFFGMLCSWVVCLAFVLIGVVRWLVSRRGNEAIR